MARIKEFRAAVRTQHAERIAALKAADPSKFWSVSPPGHGYRSLAVTGQVSGGEQKGFVSVKADQKAADIGGLISMPGSKGVAKSAFKMVDQMHPEHPQTLDAFDEKSRSGNINLPTLYAKHGFTETGRVPFDPQYAPPEWDEKTHGRPDVVFMHRPAAQGSLFPEQYPTTPPPKGPAPLNEQQFKTRHQGRLF